ncbi:MAG: hypothetical protein WHS38_07060 [Thermodesulforhabdaceae bacterium]
MEQREERKVSCKEGIYACPVGQFFSFVEKSLGITSEFKKHIYNSKIEFLKAVRSLIDGRIKDLEDRINASTKRAERVEIE